MSHMYVTTSTQTSTWALSGVHWVHLEIGNSALIYNAFSEWWFHGTEGWDHDSMILSTKSVLSKTVSNIFILIMAWTAEKRHQVSHQRSVRAQDIICKKPTSVLPKKMVDNHVRPYGGVSWKPCNPVGIKTYWISKTSKPWELELQFQDIAYSSYLLQ